MLCLRSAITEPEVAPPGGESLYVLVHTPYLRPHHKWSEMLPAYRDRIIEKLKQTAGLEDLEKHIVVEKALTPGHPRSLPCFGWCDLWACEPRTVPWRLSQPTDHLMLKGSTWRVDLLTQGLGCQWY